MASPRTIIIDFETYFAKDYGLRGKYGLPYPQYINHPRFHVHGLGVDVGGKQDWIVGKDVKRFLSTVTRDILVAHNGFFDFGILWWHYQFRPAYMIDTLLVANHVLGSSRDVGGGGANNNSVAALSQRLGFAETKAKKEEFYEELRDKRDLTDAEMSMVAERALSDVRIQRKILTTLLPHFSNPDFEFWVMDHTLRIYLERPLAIAPGKIGEVRKIITDRTEKLLADSGWDRTILASNTKFAPEFKKLLQESRVRLPMKAPAKPRKDGVTQIPALAKNDPAFRKLADHKNPKIANVVNARLVIRSAATVAARIKTMEAYEKLGIGIPVHLVYYGAHTGRFSGGGGFNFQNLTSPDRAQDEIDRLIAKLVREIVVSEAGESFVAVDAAQIEARIVAWVSGQDDILEAFATGADIYSKFIGDFLKQDIHKPTEEDKKDPAKAKHLTLMRNVGKEAVLGLGFQMGGPKFFKQLRAKNRDIAKMIERKEITQAMADSIVEHYRSKYTKIVDFWDEIKTVFIRAIQGIPGEVGAEGRKLKIARVKSFSNLPAVGITLPSGRVLYYRELRKVTEPGFMGGNVQVWKHGNGQKIYGGLLTENVVQAMARDVLVEAMYAAEVEQEYPVALTIHDEIVLAVGDDKAQPAHDFLVKALSTPPTWGTGMVLAAEGRIGKSMAK